jgi:hypothetical protein
VFFFFCIYFLTWSPHLICDCQVVIILACHKRIVLPMLSPYCCILKFVGVFYFQIVPDITDWKCVSSCFSLYATKILQPIIFLYLL